MLWPAALCSLLDAVGRLRISPASAGSTIAMPQSNLNGFCTQQVLSRLSHLAPSVTRWKAAQQCYAQKQDAPNHVRSTVCVWCYCHSCHPHDHNTCTAAQVWLAQTGNNDAPLAPPSKLGASHGLLTCTVGAWVRRPPLAAVVRCWAVTLVRFDRNSCCNTCR